VLFLEEVGLHSLKPFVLPAARLLTKVRVWIKNSKRGKVFVLALVAFYVYLVVRVVKTVKAFLCALLARLK